MEAIVPALTTSPVATTANQTEPAISESDSPFAPLLSRAISEKENPSDKTAPAYPPGMAESLLQAFSALNMQTSTALDQAGESDFALGAESGTARSYSAIEFLLNSGLIKGTETADIRGMLAAGTEQSTTAALFPPLTSGLQAEYLTATPASLAATAASVSPDLLQGRMVDGETPAAALTGGISSKQELTLMLSQLQELIAANETKGIVVQQQPRAAISLDELTNLTSQVAQGTPAAQASLAIQPASGDGGTAPNTVPAAATAAMSDTVPAAATAPMSIVPDSMVDPVSSKAPTLRQEIAQQYLDGKINLQENQTKKEGNGQPAQQDNADNGQTGQPLNGLSSALGDSTGESTLFSIPTQGTGAGQQVAHQGKVVTLPSGTMVAEQEIFNQIVQRFNLTTRMQSSRINLKLHPAELGELKIDLTIKEGSIRANVHAQSQHVQEILERNMPKLRTVLEQQGFVVEDIVVSSKSETIGDFDLFGEQFSNRQSFTPSENHNPAPAAFSFETTFESSIMGSVFPESGLNVKA